MEGIELRKSNVLSKDVVLFIKEQVASLSFSKIIQLNLSNTLPDIFSIDRELMFRAISNVLVNAIEYTPSNGVIHIDMRLNNMQQAEIVIEDSGKGFSPTDLVEATTMFYTGDTSRNNRSHHGIGLYSANSILKLHQGGIIIENSDHLCGAKVTLYFKAS